MLRRTLTVSAAAAGSSGSSGSGKGPWPGSSGAAVDKGKAMASKFFGWYPAQGGEFLGNLLAGHNMFIQDLPKRFDRQHARHFSFVEALTIVPLFSLSMVHYFSTFCQFPGRAAMMTPLSTELSKKAMLQHEWMKVLQQRSPMDVLAWRLAMMGMQLVLFPLCLLVSSVAPQLVHATMNFTNHILVTKYECISEKAPAFVAANVAQCQQAEDWHKQQMMLPTDFGVAAVMLLVIFYLTS